MSKFLTGLLVALVGSTIVLSGCGGGGGTTTPNTPPPVNTVDRTISGQVVSSLTGNPGVPNVAIRIGTYTTVTGADGKFSVVMPIDTEIPAAFSVDTSGAGSNYANGDLVTYDSQQYLPGGIGKPGGIDVPVGIRNGISNNLGTITLRYAADAPPPVPIPNKDTIIAGRIVRSDRPSVGIPGIVVIFGTQHVVTAVTGARGYFALNAGRNTLVSDMFLDDHTFSIDTSTAGTGYDRTQHVLLEGTESLQTSIMVPNNVLTDDTLDPVDLGTITVLVAGDVPDGPPGDPWGGAH